VLSRAEIVVPPSGSRRFPPPLSVRNTHDDRVVFDAQFLELGEQMADLGIMLDMPSA